MFLHWSKWWNFPGSHLSLVRSDFFVQTMWQDDLSKSYGSCNFEGIVSRTSISVRWSRSKLRLVKSSSQSVDICILHHCDCGICC
jgi:hypothetical protein